MGNLEKRFFETKQETIIKPADKDAPIVVSVLKKGLHKGNFILRGGRSTNYDFRLDSIY